LSFEKEGALRRGTKGGGKKRVFLPHGVSDISLGQEKNGALGSEGRREKIPLRGESFMPFPKREKGARKVTNQKGSRVL